MSEVRLPLEGVKVVELATFIAAPCTARFLADLGADVIKVEAPKGDPLRYTAVHILRLGECRKEMYFLEHEIRRRKRSSGKADCRCGCIYLQLASGTAEESRPGLGNPPRKVSGTGIRLCFRIRRSGTGQRSAGIRFHRILCKRRNSWTAER